MPLPPFHHLPLARLRGLPIVQVPVWCTSCWACYRHLVVRPRVVVGYHGCLRSFARQLVSGRMPIRDWQRSGRDYEWLGEGVYFWENAPGRAWQWAREFHRSKADPAVVAVAVRLGRCFDLADTRFVSLLQESYSIIVNEYRLRGIQLPSNTGRDAMFRRLDCLVINRSMTRLDQLYQSSPLAYQTIRSPFEEGLPIYPGAAFRQRSHIQIAVRDLSCIRSPVYLVEEQT